MKLKKAKKKIQYKKLILVGLLILGILGVTIAVNTAKLSTKSKASGIDSIDQIEFSKIVRVKDAEGKDVLCAADSTGATYTCETTSSGLTFGLADERVSK